MKTKMAAHTTKGKVATHKNSFAKRKVTPPAPEQIEVINVTLGVERIAGVTTEQLRKHLVELLEHVGESLGSDDMGPRFNVETGPNTIVELTQKEPYWRTIDIEPMNPGRRRQCKGDTECKESPLRGGEFCHEHDRLS